MNDDAFTDHEPLPPTHWDMCAQAMDLTIEGQRLIAQEIVHELRLLWRAAPGWARDMAAPLRRDARRGTG